MTNADQTDREIYAGRVVTLRLKYLRQPDGRTHLRELAEETGFSAEHVEPLVRFYTSPGFSTELIHIFVATSLRECTVEHDEEEDIELVRMPLEAAIRQVLEGELSDAKTVAGLLAYRQRISSG